MPNISAPMARRTGSCPLSSLSIRIVGGGAVGLACGYLLRCAGHVPSHVCLRERVLPAVPVTTADAVQDPYTPRMAQATDIADATLIAVGPDRMAEALSKRDRGLIAGQGPVLVLCAHPVPGQSLVAPLWSAEICPRDGLGLIHASMVEFSGTDAEAALLEGMGFGAVRRVPVAQFTGRALQTGAAYVVLLALAERRITRAAATLGLLLSVRDALVQRVQAQGRDVRLPGDTDRALAALATHLAAAAPRGLFARNLAVLTGPDRRKLRAHLRPVSHLGPAAPGEPCRKIDRLGFRTARPCLTRTGRGTKNRRDI